MIASSPSTAGTAATPKSSCGAETRPLTRPSDVSVLPAAKPSDHGYNYEMRTGVRGLLLSLVSLALVYGDAYAQSIIAISRSAGAPVTRVNLATGALQLTSWAGTPEPMFGVGTIDVSNRTAYFVGDDRHRGAELAAFGLKNSERRAIPYAFTGGLPWLVWDQKGHRLLSIRGYPIQVIAISAAGATTMIVQLDTMYGGLIWGIYAFDPSGGRLFFKIGTGDPELLAVVDISTGEYYVVPMTGSGHWFLRYDPASDRLLTYGINNACKPEIRSIDPATGLEEILADVPPGMGGASTSVSALDEEGRRLFYLSESNNQLVSFDLERHTFSSTPFPMAGEIAVMDYLPSPVHREKPERPRE